MFGRNARAGITHTNDDGAALERGAQRDAPSSRGVAQGVRRKILERLLEPHRIARHDFRPGRDARRQLDALLFGRAAVAREHTPEQIFERHVLRVERLAPSFEPRQIEQVADDVLDALRFVADDGEVPIAGLGIERLCVQRERFEIAAHAGERRHQLM